MNKTSQVRILQEDELMHHGILGMKWGIRRYQPYSQVPRGSGKRGKEVGEAKSVKNAVSVKAAGHRALAKVYEINEKTYKKSNKTLSSMNKAAKEEQMKKAEKAQAEANEKKAKKVSAREERKQKLLEIDPSVAKNKETKRVAMDYHLLTDDQFRRKYKGTKEKFAKRYVKYNGDTYSAGKRKAAVSAMIIANSPDVKYLSPRGLKVRTLKGGKGAAVKQVAKDVAYSKVVTGVGYKKAEKDYEEYKKRKKG